MEYMEAAPLHTTRPTDAQANARAEPARVEDEIMLALIFPEEHDEYQRLLDDLDAAADASSSYSCWPPEGYPAGATPLGGTPLGEWPPPEWLPEAHYNAALWESS